MAAAFAAKEPFQSWGRVARRAYPTAHPRFAADVPALFTAPDRPSTVLPVGAGRSYGDSCLNAGGGLISMRGLDRLIEIDEEALTLTAQAGVTLSAAIQAVMRKGLFLPVLPGTRFATLGGCLANDVHGKNHAEAGTFGAHVRRFELARSDGSRTVVEPGSDLFAATVGGLGLTGIVTWIELNLLDVDSAYLDAEDIAFATLDDYAALMAESGAFPYRVAWIDCTAPGRGVFSRARFRDDGRIQAHTDKTKLRAPAEAPGFLINRASLSVFNRLYAAAKGSRKGLRPVHYAPFFFPLDSIGGWNKLYGGKGFYQYQCVLPPATARDAAQALLDAIAIAGDGSMLAVLKDFSGYPSPGLLSFPMEGTTLALDFRNRGEKTMRLFDRLDAIVSEAGGRLYPAKDGRIPAALFQRMYPRWREVEARRDPAIQSDFWARVSAA
jgi:L-gulonolactone oxidase